MGKNSTLTDKFKNSASGLYFALKSEKAVRNEFLMVLILQLVCIILDATWKKSSAVFLISCFPVIAELVNTSCETMIDKICGSNYREEIKNAKDMLSASVFITLCASYGIILLLLFI